MSATNNNYSNKDNDNYEIAPDMPEMRAMLIQSLAPAIPQLRGFSYTKEAQHEPILMKRAPIASPIISWQPSSIPQLPDYYPLERSHARVTDGNSNEVAHRIAEYLRNESIAATFTENKAVAETPCHTQFHVQLFESEDALIVEVQRRTGCSYTFRQCSKAILSAAMGQPPSVARPAFSIPTSLPPLPVSGDEEEALKIAFGLLAEDRLDAQLLGMQSLLSMTKCVTFQTDQLAVICKHATSRQSELRRDALTVLANCWSSSSSKNTVVTSDDLVRTLIADLTDKDLHVAHQAARCLTALLQKSSHEVKATLLHLGSYTATQVALQEGQSRHALLEQEARLLQMELKH